MPAAYTHYKFGQEVLYAVTNRRVKEVVARYPKMFDLGLFGPDILFYYGLPGKDKLYRIGFSMHRQLAAFFFRDAKEMILEACMYDKGACLAYCFGCVCHFVLDSECHSHIEYMMMKCGISHTELEMDWERQLMLKDGYDPMRYNPVQIRVSRKEAEQVSRFYPGVSQWDVAISVKHMRQITGLLLPTNPIKAGLLHAVVGLSGQGSRAQGLIMKKNGNVACAKCTERLQNQFVLAMPLALELMDNYYAYVTGTEKLARRFYRTYGADMEELQKIMEQEYL